MNQEAAATGVSRLALPPENPLRSFAAALLQAAPSARTLAGQTVVLPHAGLVVELSRALHVAAGGPSALPRMTTLHDWLALQPVPPVTLSDSQLVVELHRQLAARPWLAGADHWAMAAELAGLFEALGRNSRTLPATAGALAAILETAHQTRASALLRLDAQLVHQLWHACEGQPEWGLSRWQRDALAMAHLLQAPEGPLWVFDAERSTVQANSFYERYALLVPVTLVRLDAAAGERSGWVHCACADQSAALAARARAWAAGAAGPPQGIRLHRALGREGEAGHVCDTVCEWLAAGLQRIAVVATDRALARRLRALLERRGVLAEDNAGWSLATTRVGAAVRDLLRLQARSTPSLLAACADSPLVAAAARDSLLAALGPALAAQPPHARLDWDDLTAAVASSPVASAWLAQTRETLRGMGGRARSMADWIDTVLAALDQLAPHLALDPAGRQLLAHLQQARQALDRDAAPRGRRDLAGWLDWTLENSLFRDASVSSPVLLTHQAALRGMHFDALIVAGADAAHLPVAGARPRIVRDAALAELGLPGAPTRRAWAVDDWCLLMGSAPRIVITWQVLDDRGEPNVASPLVQLMQGFHELAWGEPLPQAMPFQPLTVASPQALLPVEEAVLTTLPATLSPTAYQALLDCPYRWFVRQALGLKPRQEASEQVEPRDFGIAVHAVLGAFHARVPVVGAVTREVALAQLDAVAQAVFEPMLARDFAAAGWLARWRTVAPAYIDWQLDHEAAGWRVAVAACEDPVKGSLPLGTLPAVTLHGTPDRVDLRASGEPRRTVIDYKTGARKPLEALVDDPTEDAQLVLYAHLIEHVTEVAYLPLGSDAVEKDALEPVTLSGGALQHAVSGHLERLAATLRRAAAGEPLPAMGDEKACRYCHARGLCRRDHRGARRSVVVA